MGESERELCRRMTENSLEIELNKIQRYYMAVYDEYYSDNSSTDSAFLKDLVDALKGALKGISAVLEVYVEYKGIHPDYALERLNWSRSFIDASIRYYESKKENKNNECE